MVGLRAAAIVPEQQVLRHRDLLVSWAAPVEALHSGERSRPALLDIVPLLASLRETCGRDLPSSARWRRATTSRQSAHQLRCPSTSSRGASPRLGAPMTRISRPSGPASYPRHAPGGTRTASHSLSSRISSSTSIRPLPRPTTYTSSCLLCVWP